MRSLQGDSYQGSRIVASGGLAEWLFRVEIAHRGQRFIGGSGSGKYVALNFVTAHLPKDFDCRFFFHSLSNNCKPEIDSQSDNRQISQSIGLYAIDYERHP